MSDIQKQAEEMVAETAKIENFAYRGDLDLGKTWAFTISKNRDSGLLGESNWDTITKDMEKKFPKSTEIVRASHWAVGWVEHFAVKMLDKNGKVTKAGEAMIEWVNALADYPIADEDDYSHREYEATLENIDSELSRIADDYGVPEKALKSLPSEVYSWLSDNNQSAVENSDDQGGYPSRDELCEALEGLGYTKTED